MQVTEDVVAVRRDEEQRPEQFLWRGRLWSVRDVLARPGVEHGVPEVWRVRAAAGRLAALLREVGDRSATGAVVVDLAFDWVTGDWRLREVAGEPVAGVVR